MKKLIFLVCLLVTTLSYADHEEHPVIQENLPSLCSTPEGIKSYMYHMNMKPVAISLGREGIKEDGQPVFMITQYENESGSETAAVIDIPSGMQSCLMYHTFDLTKVN
jgi:hypothetical protein